MILVSRAVSKSIHLVAGLTFRDGECWAPLVPQYVQANAAVAVDVRVVDAGGEVDLWWLEWVVCGEVNRKEEDTAGVW